MRPLHHESRTGPDEELLNSAWMYHVFIMFYHVFHGSNGAFRFVIRKIIQSSSGSSFFYGWPYGCSDWGSPDWNPQFGWWNLQVSRLVTLRQLQGVRTLSQKGQVQAAFAHLLAHFQMSHTQRISFFLVTRGWMKTLALKSAILTLGFQHLGF